MNSIVFQRNIKWRVYCVLKLSVTAVSLPSSDNFNIPTSVILVLYIAKKPVLYSRNCMESNEDDRIIICIPLQKITINLPCISPTRAVMML